MSNIIKNTWHRLKHTVILKKITFLYDKSNQTRIHKLIIKSSYKNIVEENKYFYIAYYFYKILIYAFIFCN